MRNDPEVVPKIAQISEQLGIDTATVIAFLAMNALANSDFRNLSFWADVSNELNPPPCPN